MWLYLAIVSGALGSRVIPLAWRYRIATIIADFLWLIWTSKRRNCIDNMAVVLNEHPKSRHVRRVARHSFQLFGKGIVDFLGFSNVDPNDPLLRDMPITGWEHAEEALRRGKGVILATAHFGSIDLGGLALGSRTPNFYAVADTFQPKAVDNLIQGARRSKGFRIIPTSSARRIIKALRENALVVVLFDKPVAREAGVPVQFFGRETALPAGPAVLAMRTGATIVPAYVFRQPDNSLRGLVFPPVTDDLGPDRAWNERMIMQRLANTLEHVVAEGPEQWYMFRNMWPEASGHDVPSELHEASAGGATA